jgi:hypothetical protein
LRIYWKNKLFSRKEAQSPDAFRERTLRNNESTLRALRLYGRSIPESFALFAPLWETSFLFPGCIAWGVYAKSKMRHKGAIVILAAKKEARFSSRAAIR